MDGAGATGRLVCTFVRITGRYAPVGIEDATGRSIVIFVVTLICIVSPIDLIPDYLIGLGQIDDVALLGFSLYFLEKELKKYKEWKDREQ